jgi:hypothetical protein
VLVRQPYPVPSAPPLGRRVDPAAEITPSGLLCLSLHPIASRHHNYCHRHVSTLKPLSSPPLTTPSPPLSSNRRRHRRRRFRPCRRPPVDAAVDHAIPTVVLLSLTILQYIHAHPRLASPRLLPSLHGTPTTHLLRSLPSSAPPSRLASSPGRTGKPCSVGGPQKGTSSNLISSLFYFISLPSQSQVIHW